MKIALIGTTAGCVIGFRSDLIKAMIERGHIVYAFALDYSPETKNIVNNLGAIAIDYSFSRTGLNPFRDILDTIKLANILKELSPDMVFSYFAKPVIFGTIASVIANVKYKIGMFEGLGFSFIDHAKDSTLKFRIIKKLQILLYKISIPLLDKIIFLNQDDPKDLLEANTIKAKSVFVLGGIGVDLVEFSYKEIQKEKVEFIFIARLLVEKGIRDFIEAAKIVKQNYPKVQFTVLGGLDIDNPGGLREFELAQLIKEGIIHYPGHVSNVKDWLANSSVFVLPSYYREGVPRSTQEAMAIGRPIITTDAPGCRDTVIEGRNGFLVPVKSPLELSKAMTQFIEHPELITQMGIESRKIAEERFDSKLVNERLLKELNLL